MVISLTSANIPTVKREQLVNISMQKYVPLSMSFYMNNAFIRFTQEQCVTSNWKRPLKIGSTLTHEMFSVLT